MKKLLHGLVLGFILGSAIAVPFAQIAPGVPPSTAGLDDNPALALGAENTPGANDFRVTVTTTSSASNIYRVFISTAAACQLATNDVTLTPISATVLVATLVDNQHELYLIAAGPAVFNLNLQPAGAGTRYFNLEYQGRCVSIEVAWTA